MLQASRHGVLKVVQSEKVLFPLYVCIKVKIQIQM